MEVGVLAGWKVRRRIWDGVVRGVYWKSIQLMLDQRWVLCPGGLSSARLQAERIQCLRVDGIMYCRWSNVRLGYHAEPSTWF